MFISTLIFSSCGNKKDGEKNSSEINIEKSELPEKVFTEFDIAKYTISAIMNQPPEIITVKDNGGIYEVFYKRKDDGEKFYYKIKIVGNNVTWGNSDGRWRDTSFDEKIRYTEKDNELKIIQTSGNGSKNVKEFTKTK